MLRARVGASMLASDLASMASDAQRVVGCGSDYLHLDIMDGCFVPNLSWGPPVIASLRRHTKAFLDCHLMVAKPAPWVGAIQDAGGDQYTFHAEAAPAAERAHPRVHLALRALRRRVPRLARRRVEHDLRADVEVRVQPVLGQVAPAHGARAELGRPPRRVHVERVGARRAAPPRRRASGVSAAPARAHAAGYGNRHTPGTGRQQFSLRL